MNIIILEFNTINLLYMDVKELSILPSNSCPHKISFLELLPNDVLSLILIYCSYPEIVKIFTICKKFSRINNEIFFKRYAEIRDIKKERVSDTYKQIVILYYLGKYERRQVKLLAEIQWIITEPPINLERMSTAESFIYVNLTQEEYNQIVFRDNVTISVPHIEDLEKITNHHQFVKMCDKKEIRYIEFELQPNTPAGSTVKYVLHKIYEKINTQKSNVLIIKQFYFTGLFAHKGSYITAFDVYI